jgi:peptidoglycan/LPS O-acetylase OafA/YrhL
MSAASESGGRFVALDGLRGLAALLVVFHHIEWPNHLTNNNLVQNSYLFVDLFFILSGFIIFTNYNTRIADVGDVQKFICLRFFRIYPLHIILIIILVCLELAKLFTQSALPTESTQVPFTNENSIRGLLANIILFHGLHVLDHGSWNIPSWSISCEFYAYIVFAILTVSDVIHRKWFFPCVGLMSTCIYLVVAASRDGLDVTYDWGMARCLAGFFLGAMVANMKWPRSDLPGRYLRGGDIAILFAVIVLMSTVKGWAIGFVIPLFVVGVALLQSDDGLVARALMHRSFQFAGRISYSIYMVQFLAIIFLMIVLKRLFKVPLFADQYTQRPTLMINPWIGDLLVVGVVLGIILIAGLTYRWIESPGRAFGRDFISWRHMSSQKFIKAKGVTTQM